jgi:uncharacterized protein (TIGR00251 family)
LESPDVSFISESLGFITIAVRVQPGARKSEILGVHGGELKLRVSTPPVEGAANAALIDFIAECLNVRRTAVNLIRGSRSRSKILKIEGISKEEALLALGWTPL